jgi:hypothetical protein
MRGRQAPDQQVRPPFAQPGQRELRLHAALAAQQFMPFIDDDGMSS